MKRSNWKPHSYRETNDLKPAFVFIIAGFAGALLGTALLILIEYLFGSEANRHFQWLPFPVMLICGFTAGNITYYRRKKQWEENYRLKKGEGRRKRETSA